MEESTGSVRTTTPAGGRPPAGVVVLTLPVDASIEPGVAQLSAFWWP